MIANAARIPEAIEERKQDFLGWAKAQPARHYANDPTYAMVGCVFVQQTAANRYHVGWRFTKRGTPVGEVQADTHATPYPDQTIAWTAEGVQQ